MIRTKYLFIAVLGCIGLILCMGIFSTIFLTNETSLFDARDVVFMTPQNSYTVRTEVEDIHRVEREVFISKVRDSLKDEPVRAQTVVQEASPTTSIILNELVATSTTDIPVESIIGTGTPIAR